MSKKQDFILEYIKNLTVGSKVSIRSLAENLHVSEGTAYKAIKKAEDAGLVHTRPRAGTVRIAEQSNSTPSELTISKLTQYIGLSVIIPFSTDFTIDSFIIGDGSLEQLKRDAEHTNGNKLCIVGNRPDIQFEALKLGMHLLITGDTQPSMELMHEAMNQDLCVLSSHHSCHNLIHFIHTLDGYSISDSPTQTAGDWMHKPEYLYYNDILSDWYRTYLPIFSLNDNFAIVNDDLNICGSLNASAIIHASPEERISDLYDPGANTVSFTITETASIQDAARKMIANNTELLFIEKQGKLRGYITANDILRFYHFNQAPSKSESCLSLIRTEYKENTCHQVYHVPSDFIPEKEYLMSIISKIADEHIKHYYKTDTYKLVNGNFYTASDLKIASELTLYSEITQLSDQKCICEITVSSCGSNKWKYIYFYSLN